MYINCRGIQSNLTLLFPFLGCQKFKQLCNNPVFKHCQLLIVFFILSICLLTADIVTDFVSAVQFYKQGDTYWGLFTLIPIFAPFVVQSSIILKGLCQCYKFQKIQLALSIYFYWPTRKNMKYNHWKSELKQLHWHFPMFQPIR